MRFETFVIDASYQENSYVLYDKGTKEAAIIDPSAPSDALFTSISKRGFRLTKILNTHGHLDHIGGNEFFKKKSNAKLYIHTLDAATLEDTSLNLSFFTGKPIVSPKADVSLEDKEIIKFGGTKIEVIHTPGHTRGSVCFLWGTNLFSGDTLFAGGMGRTDFPGGSASAIRDSIKNKLFFLPEETIVLPGHGASSTIGNEIKTNPFFTE